MGNCCADSAILESNNQLSNKIDRINDRLINVENKMINVENKIEDH